MSFAVSGISLGSDLVELSLAEAIFSESVSARAQLWDGGDGVGALDNVQQRVANTQSKAVIILALVTLSKLSVSTNSAPTSIRCAIHLRIDERCLAVGENSCEMCCSEHNQARLIVLMPPTVDRAYVCESLTEDGHQKKKRTVYDDALQSVRVSLIHRPLFSSFE